MAGHRIVEDDQIGTERPRHDEGGRAIVGLTDDREIALFREERAEALANGEVIVGDENANHRSWPPLYVREGCAETVVGAPVQGVPLSGETGSGGFAEGDWGDL